MRNRFEGKVIAVAGGSGGIGGGVSLRVAEEGAIVLVGDINLDAAEKMVAEIETKGGKATPYKLDIGDEDNIASFVQTAVKLHGGLDGFHVNAYDSSNAKDDLDITTMDMAAYDRMMDVNMRGNFLCTRYAVPAMVARGGGCMLYTSSGAAYVGDAVRPVYAMTKSAIHALARNVASRFGKQGVRGNVIAPGVILHPAVEAVMGKEFAEHVTKSLKVPKIGTPKDIAAMAALLMSDEGEYITGQVICVDGGTTMRP